MEPLIILREKFLILNNLNDMEITDVFSKHRYLGKLPNAK